MVYQHDFFNLNYSPKKDSLQSKLNSFHLLFLSQSNIGKSTGRSLLAHFFHKLGDLYIRRQESVKIRTTNRPRISCTFVFCALKNTEVKFIPSNS